MLPQKRNLSALEILRAQTVLALQGQMLLTLAGLSSGHNGDDKKTKAPLIEGAPLCRESLEMMALFIWRLEVHAARVRDACSAEVWTSDRALELARQGVPFRDAEVAVATNPGCGQRGLLSEGAASAEHLEEHLRARTYEGAAGHLDLGQHSRA